MSRAGVAPEAVKQEEQLEAPPVIAAAKQQKPPCSSGDLEHTAAVFDALMRGGPTDAETLARAFKQGAKIEPAIARILVAMARLGHAYSVDGTRFALSRAA